MLIPTAELVSVWVKGCGLLAFWSLWFGGLDGRRKEESSRGIVSAFSFLFSKPFLWSGKAKYRAAELKEISFPDVLLMNGSVCPVSSVLEKNRPRKRCQFS